MEHSTVRVERTLGLDVPAPVPYVRWSQVHRVVALDRRTAHPGDLLGEARRETGYPGSELLLDPLAVVRGVVDETALHVYGQVQ